MQSHGTRADLLGYLGSPARAGMMILGAVLSRLAERFSFATSAWRDAIAESVVPLQCSVVCFLRKAV
jgi:hypothetical protein